MEQSVLGEYRSQIGGKVKLSPTTVIDAHNSVYFDTISPYYVGSQDSSQLNIYNSYIRIIRDDSKDIMNRFEKTILVNNLLGI